MVKKRLSQLCLWLMLAAALLGCAMKLGLLWGETDWHQLRYFTTLSNILVAIYALFAIFGGRSAVPPLLHGIGLMGIVITGVIYHLLLRGLFGGFDPFTRAWLADQLVHTAVPVLMVVDWLCFAPKGCFRWMHLLGWTAYPLGYWVGVVVLAGRGMRFPNSNTPYPYPFMDVWVLGWNRALGNVAVMSCGFVAVGILVVALDRWLGSFDRKQRGTMR